MGLYQYRALCNAWTKGIRVTFQHETGTCIISYTCLMQKKGSHSAICLLIVCMAISTNGFRKAEVL